MKKLLVVLVVISLMMVFASTAFAAPGGMPGAHGVDGPTFGGAISARALECPIGLAGHVSGCFGP